MVQHHLRNHSGTSLSIRKSKSTEVILDQECRFARESAIDEPRVGHRERENNTCPATAVRRMA